MFDLTKASFDRRDVEIMQAGTSLVSLEFAFGMLKHIPDTAAYGASLRQNPVLLFDNLDLLPKYSAKHLYRNYPQLSPASLDSAEQQIALGANKAFIDWGSYLFANMPSMGYQSRRRDFCEIAPVEFLRHNYSSSEAGTLLDGSIPEWTVSPAARWVLMAHGLMVFKAADKIRMECGLRGIQPFGSVIDLLSEATTLLGLDVPPRTKDEDMKITSTMQGERSLSETKDQLGYRKGSSAE